MKNGPKILTLKDGTKISLFFKTPVEFSGKKFYILYGLPEENVLRGIDFNYFYVLLSNEKGEITPFLNELEKKDLIVSFKDTLFDNWTKDVRSDNLYEKEKLLTEARKKFFDVIRIQLNYFPIEHTNYSITKDELNNVYTCMSISSCLKDYRDALIPYDVTPVVNTANDKVQYLIKKLGSLSTLSQKLSPFEEDLIRNFHFSELLSLRKSSFNFLWTRDYEEKVVSEVIDAYEEKVGHMLFIPILFEKKELFEEEKALLRFLSNLYGTTEVGKIERTVQFFYSTKGIDYKKEVDLFNGYRKEHAKKGDFLYLTSVSSISAVIKKVNIAHVRRKSTGDFTVYMPSFNGRTINDVSNRTNVHKYAVVFPPIESLAVFEEEGVPLR